jgi:NAD(P)-dependent dehydrogenase (short-subunit alcohol dehydrogenase family)
MKRQGSGKILNFSRAGGAQSFKPMMLAYNCAKAGIDALTTTLAREGKAFGIIVPRVAQPVSSLRNPWDEPELRARWPSKRYSKTWPVSVLWHFP